MSIFVGIDPGINGAIAAINATHGGMTVLDIPTWAPNPRKPKRREINLGALVSSAEMIRAAGRVELVMIEEVHAMPDQGVTSMFNFGLAYGVLQGVFAAQGCVIEKVRPQVWKKAMGLTADKNDARARAVVAFSDQAVMFKRVKDHNRAEAALLALYACSRNV